MKIIFSFLLLLMVAGCAPAFAGIEMEALHTKDWLDLSAFLVPIASLIASKTKTDKDNKAVGLFSQIVNLFALNLDKLGKR